MLLEHGYIYAPMEHNSRALDAVSHAMEIMHINQMAGLGSTGRFGCLLISFVQEMKDSMIGYHLCGRLSVRQLPELSIQNL